MSSTSLLSRRLRQASELGIGLSLIATLVLAGCGGGTTSSSTGTSSATVSTTDMTVTPMKGQFSAGATVLVKLASDLSVVASGVVGADGTAVIKVPSNKTGPFLIEAGKAGDSYFDEASGASAVVPAGTVALRALIPDTASAVGVTALTEMAVGQIEAASGITAAKAADVIAANTTIGNQFGVADPLTPPTVIAATTATTAKITGGNTADDYALKLAGIAKMAASGVPALKALHDLRDDMKDGKLDGLVNTAPITSLKITIPAGGATLTQMSQAIANQVQAATTQYANANATAPTVTLTVQDLAGLLQAAMKVGAEAGKTDSSNSQLASTLRTQVNSIATAVGNGSTMTAATTTAITAVQSSANSSTGLGNHSASGTYIWNAATGLMNSSVTTSDFLASCAGPVIGTSSQTVSVTATSMTGGVNNPTWTRTSGTAGDVVGTWTATTQGGTLTLIMSANGTFSMSGNITACASGNGGSNVTSTSTSNSIVGTWTQGGTHTFSFDAKGNYTLNITAVSGTTQYTVQQLQVWPGTEQGKYTFDLTAGTLTITCPTVDGNGTAGISGIAPGGYTAHGGSPIGSACPYTTKSFPVTFTGANMALSGTGVTWTRQ